MKRVVGWMSLVGVAMALNVVAQETNVSSEASFVLGGDAAKGEAPYKTYCITCHGEMGDGNGIAGAALNPKPANFTDKNFMSSLSDKAIYTAISDGGIAVGKSPLMTAWKGLLSDEQIRDVAAFVKTFAAKTGQ